MRVSPGRQAVCSGWIGNLRALPQPRKERCGRHQPPGSVWAGSCGDWGVSCDEPTRSPATQEGQTTMDCRNLLSLPYSFLAGGKRNLPFGQPERFTLTIPHSLRRGRPLLPLSADFRANTNLSWRHVLPIRASCPWAGCCLLFSKDCTIVTACRAFCLRPAPCMETLLETLLQHPAQSAP